MLCTCTSPHHRLSPPQIHRETRKKGRIKRKDEKKTLREKGESTDKERGIKERNMKEINIKGRKSFWT